MLWSCTVHGYADLLFNVFVKVSDPVKLAYCGRVCKNWNIVSCHNALWRELCTLTWWNKTYVPNKYRELLRRGSAREALIGSILDSRRMEITREEISSFSFYFRFKKAAGSHWTGRDPFWRREKPLRICFSKDGPVLGFPQVRWNFVDDGENFCQGTCGSLISVDVRGLPVPTYRVSRHSNWGFIMQVSRLSTYVPLFLRVASLRIGHRRPARAELLGRLLLLPHPPTGRRPKLGRQVRACILPPRSTAQPRPARTALHHHTKQDNSITIYMQ
jgi:hypothetical protein